MYIIKTKHTSVIALQWELLLNANIWKDAATQMFFTLSLGFGALIAFASYMPLHNQVMRDAYTVVFINCGTSVFAGIVVFSILGYREHVTGISVTEVCIPFQNKFILRGHLHSIKLTVLIVSGRTECNINTMKLVELSKATFFNSIRQG